jgi:hypothetical protein
MDVFTTIAAFPQDWTASECACNESLSSMVKLYTVQGRNFLMINQQECLV